MKFSDEQAVRVAIGEYALSDYAVSGGPGEVLVAYGIGSCVVITFYDPHLRVGGLLHAALPLNNVGRGPRPAKYVDAGLEAMLNDMSRAGAHKERLIVQMAGGGNLLPSPGFANTFDMGRRNIAAAELVIAREGLRLAAADVGGSRGRTVRLYVGSGTMTVQVLGQDERALVAAPASANVASLPAALCGVDYAPRPAAGILE